MSDLIAEIEHAFQSQNWPTVQRLALRLAKTPAQQPLAWHWQALVALHQQQFGKASNLYAMALRHQPGNPTLAQQAAALAAEQKDPAKSITILQTLLQHQPGHLSGQEQLGEMYIRTGQFAPAQTLLHTLAPQSGLAKIMLWLLQNQLLPASQAPTPNALAGVALSPIARTQVWLQQLLKMWELRDAPGLQTALEGLHLAVTAYAQTFQNPLDEQKGKKLISSFKGFISFFKVLKQQGNMPPPLNPSQPPLMVLGDSHCLSPLGQTAILAGVPHQLLARVVVGIKYKHLAEQGGNTYKAQLAHWLGTLPPGMPVLLSIGEIDLRHDEGIWHHHHKTGRPLPEIIHTTFPPALATLAQLKKELCPTRPILLCGLPQPGSYRLGFLPPEQHAAYLAMAAQAAASLAAAAAHHGFPLIPLWESCTEDAFLPQDGHLRPTILPAAITAAGV